MVFPGSYDQLSDKKHVGLWGPERCYPKGALEETGPKMKISWGERAKIMFVRVWNIGYSGDIWGSIWRYSNIPTITNIRICWGHRNIYVDSHLRIHYGICSRIYQGDKGDHQPSPTSSNAGDSSGPGWESDHDSSDEVRSNVDGWGAKGLGDHQERLDLQRASPAVKLRSGQAR